MKYVIPLSVAALLGGVVTAQEAQVQPQREIQLQAGREGVADKVDPSARTQPRTLEQNVHAMRASELMGLAVRNDANEELGDIEDVVIDLNTGKIRYAAVSMGGFLGLGDKLFAVPFDTITFRTHRDDGVLVDTTERVAVVKINKQSLENAQGFDQDNWPNMADRQWQELNDRPYRTGVRRPLERRTLER